MSIKRKILAIILMLSVVLCMYILTGCGNENWGFGNYTFRHVHISNDVNGYCAEINSWHDNESGIELHTKEFGNIYCSEGTYFLFEDQSGCPFCK